MGCAGTVQMCHQVLVKLCWLHLAQEGLAVLSNLRLSSTSPGASGSRGFFWHRFVTGWIMLVGDNLSHIPAHLSEGLEFRIYRCLSLCIKHVELHVLSLPSFLSFWEHLAAVAASTSCLCYHRGLIRAQPAGEHCSRGADLPGEAAPRCPRPSTLLRVLTSPLYSWGRRLPGLQVPRVHFSITPSVFLGDKYSIMKELVVTELKYGA